MPDLWTIRCYVSARGIDEIKAWYDGLPARARAKFDNRLGSLRQLPRHLWRRPLFDLLGGECTGLGEIRFGVGGVEYRPLGFFSPGQTFTLVIGATERDGRFEPRNACAIGLGRRAEVESLRERSRAYTF